LPFSEQVTVTGHDPGVVFRPTIQVQLAAPVPSAVAGPSPAAFDGPLLYRTTILQFAPGRVRTDAAASSPGETGDVSPVKATRSGPAVGGFGVAVFGAAVGVGGGVAAVVCGGVVGEALPWPSPGEPSSAGGRVGVSAVDIGPEEEPHAATAPTTMTATKR
jgi:hypothetical protein